ncbi:VOC family protein [Bacillus carboniphilus]|uniref:VOC family protein n=1 Tax=Bacillus carboniphilus TaxID=86663 RepID=A0ABY9JUB9_9BACI|nr:VOC family protein [Bacillus carboniphilus]WLR43012.1 VOC family protein [Bacillus carboniphilus]
MIGLPDEKYHLEFTQKEYTQTLPSPTMEHLLVFYYPDRFARDQKVSELKQLGYQLAEPENPYWKRGGVTFLDPDGYPVTLMNWTGI